MFNIQKTKTIICFSLMLFLLCFVAVPSVLAITTAETGLTDIGTATDLGNEDLKTTIGKVIKVALGFLGVIAIIIVLVGGFKYMIAGGSDEKTGEARKWIISGVIGLAIILAAYAITSFVISELISATSDDTAPVTTP